MELRRYWQIVWRYWWLVLALTLVGVLAAYQYYTSNRPTYQAYSVINITQIPSSNDDYSGIYANQSSEYAADELLKVVSGSMFLSGIAVQLKEGNLNYSADELKGMIIVERKHRALTVTASSNNPVAALQVVRTVASTLEVNVSEYLRPRQLVANTLDVSSSASLNGGRSVLLAVVRVLAGLIAGIGLAFLLAYLDNSIRTKAEAEETLGLPVMGIIPPFKSTPAEMTAETGRPSQSKTESAKERVISR